MRAAPLAGALLVACLLLASAPAALAQVKCGTGATAEICPIGGRCNGNRCLRNGAAFGNEFCPATPQLLRKCGEKCVNQLTDNDNCGACGNQCSHPRHPLGAVCVSVGTGTTATASCQCPAGQTACTPPGSTTSVCVNTNNDPEHCGGCNLRCNEGHTCGARRAGQCDGACPAGFDDDPAFGLFCLNVRTSRVLCTPPPTADEPRPRPVECPPGVPCEGGFCKCPNQAKRSDGSLAFGPNNQPIMEIACGGACVNPLTSDSHCGGCELPVGPGGTCENGAMKCADGFIDCDGVCWKGSLDTMDNCGSCGNVCHSTQICANNKYKVVDVHTGVVEAMTCRCAETKDEFDEAKAADRAGINAWAGEKRFDCGDGVCIDVTRSNGNCGGCPTPLVTDPVTHRPVDGPNGLPIPAENYLAAYGLDPATPFPGYPAGTIANSCPDDAHCSPDGHGPGKAGCKCNEGFVQCGPGFTSNKYPDQSVCVDLQTDNNHCGACFARVPANGYCEEGNIVCNEGFTLCGGECVNFQTDFTHCGGCSLPDNAPSAAAAAAAAKDSPFNCANIFGADRCVEGKCQCRSAVTQGTRTSPALIPHPVTNRCTNPLYDNTFCKRNGEQTFTNCTLTNRRCSNGRCV